MSNNFLKTFSRLNFAPVEGGEGDKMNETRLFKKIIEVPSMEVNATPQKLQRQVTLLKSELSCLNVKDSQKFLT